MNIVESTVQTLLQARRSGTTAPAPTLPDADAAYAVQDGVAASLGWFSPGAPRAWKSGGPSRMAPQTHAALPPAGVWNSPADATRWPFHRRGIEAEVAVRLAQPADAGRAAAVDLATVRELVDAMTVSIEVVDSRWTESTDAPPLAKLADLQLHGALVLGTWVPLDAQRDWATQDCSVRIGAQAVQHFRGTHSMADPLFVLPAWLRHATRGGALVPAGTVVTTGTWCGLLWAQPGDAVQVIFDGIGEARLQL